MSDEFDEHMAKEEILRLSKFLCEPILLIGGLAVQQYVLERSSKDIDIVCDLATQKHLLKTAYGEPRYTKRQAQTDLRPVYEIKDDDTGGRIFLGSKIIERGIYPFVDYKVLADGAVPFIYHDSSADNILVPTPHSLAFSKLISFIARRDTSKAIPDLEDFAKLTNVPAFSLNSLISISKRLKATEFIEEFFRSNKLNDSEVGALSDASPIRFRTIFPIETIVSIAERGRSGIPTFSPIDTNFSIESTDISLKYTSADEIEYTKSKTLVAKKNKIGTFYDRFHWTGDDDFEMHVGDPRHLLNERPRKNVWRRYEVDFQKILQEGDSEVVSVTWKLKNKQGGFVPFISATIDCETEVLRLRLDASNMVDSIYDVQVEVLPMQGSGDPIDVLNITPEDGIFEYTCNAPRLLHTYEMRWNVIG